MDLAAGGGSTAERATAGLQCKKRIPIGYAFVHSAVDAYSRLAYSEVLPDEQGATAAGFWGRAGAYITGLGIDVERVLTDNVACYRSRHFAAALGDVTHSRSRPYLPATNGKVERFNRTLLAEWAYARPWSSDGQRTRALTAWRHRYNHHRHHTAIGGPPMRPCQQPGRALQVVGDDIAATHRREPSAVLEANGFRLSWQRQATRRSSIGAFVTQLEHVDQRLDDLARDHRTSVIIDRFVADGLRPVLFHDEARSEESPLLLEIAPRHGFVAFRDDSYDLFALRSELRRLEQRADDVLAEPRPPSKFATRVFRRLMPWGRVGDDGQPVDGDPFS